MNAQSNGAPSLPEFVPVIIIGAGPTGITAATLLGQYGIDMSGAGPPRNRLPAAARGARR